jgi:tetratricopeptide (TPR) repeat protein
MKKSFVFSVFACVVLMLGSAAASSDDDVRLRAAKTLAEQAAGLDAAGDDDAAIEQYAQIRQRFELDTSPAIRALVAEALFREARLYEKQEQTPFAMAAYERIEERFGKDMQPDIQIWVARALYERATTRISMSLSETAMSERDVLAAIALLEQMETRFGKAAETPGFPVLLASALLEKGRAYGLLGEHEEAIKICDQLEARYGKHDAPDIQPLRAAALLCKGESLANLGKNKAAVSVFKQIEERFGKNNTPEIREILEEARNARKAIR